MQSRVTQVEIVRLAMREPVAYANNTIVRASNAAAGTVFNSRVTLTGFAAAVRMAPGCASYRKMAEHLTAEAGDHRLTKVQLKQKQGPL